MDKAETVGRRDKIWVNRLGYSLLGFGLGVAIGHFVLKDKTSERYTSGLVVVVGGNAASLIGTEIDLDGKSEP